MYSSFSFAPDRQPSRPSADAQADGARRTFRRERRVESAASHGAATPPRDAAVPQADGEP